MTEEEKETKKFDAAIRDCILDATQVQVHAFFRIL